MMGGSGNVVSNIHAMGGTVAVAGIIGSDGMGDWLEAKPAADECRHGRTGPGGRAAHDGEDEDRRPRAADGPLRPGEPSRRPAGQRRPHRPLCHVHPGRAAGHRDLGLQQGYRLGEPSRRDPPGRVGASYSGLRGPEAKTTSRYTGTST